MDLRVGREVFLPTVDLGTSQSAAEWASRPPSHGSAHWQLTPRGLAPSHHTQYTHEKGRQVENYSASWKRRGCPLLLSMHTCVHVMHLQVHIIRLPYTNISSKKMDHMFHKNIKRALLEQTKGPLSPTSCFYSAKPDFFQEVYIRQPQVPSPVSDPSSSYSEVYCFWRWRFHWAFMSHSTRLTHPPWLCSRSVT